MEVVGQSDAGLKMLCEDLHNRKNWIHVERKEPGPRVAAIISMVATCQRLKICISQGT